MSTFNVFFCACQQAFFIHWTYSKGKGNSTSLRGTPVRANTNEPGTGRAARRPAPRWPGRCGAGSSRSRRRTRWKRNKGTCNTGESESKTVLAPTGFESFDREIPYQILLLRPERTTGESGDCRAPRRRSSPVQRTRSRSRRRTRNQPPKRLCSLK